MDKKIISIELLEKEFEDLKKVYEKTKSSNLVMSSVTLEDFVKQIIMTFVKGPNLEDLNGIGMNELLNSLKDVMGGTDISSFMESLGNLKKPKQEKEEKKESKQPEEEYKS